MTATKTTLLKKITMAEVFGLTRASGGFKPKAHFGANADGDFEPVLVMRVAGIVTGYEVGTTMYGDFKKFKGNIAALNAKGQEFRSPYAILPAPADDLTASMVDAANGSPVEFAFDVMAVPDAGDRGYKFQVQPLMEKVQGDPLDAIVNKVAEQFRLPATQGEKQQELPSVGEAAKTEQQPAEAEKKADAKKK